MKKAKIVDVVIPIPFEKLAEIFEMETTLAEDEKIVAAANFADCEYSGKKLLYYVANLGVEIDVTFVPTKDDWNPEPKKASFDDALELLYHYMTLDRVSSISYMNSLAAYTIAVYGDYDLSFFDGSTLGFDYDKTKAWIEQNKDLVHKWYTFLHSLPVFMIESHTGMKKVFPPEESFKEIDDINYISLNIINLILMPGYVDYIFTTTKKPTELFIFKEQFKEAIYNGKNLFQYMMQAESVVFAACISLFDKQTTIKDVLMVAKAADEAEAKLAAMKGSTE